ncbi:hypothetical protein MPH_11477 [Macrophomina phaseolina MS6]|uniref:Uncharacterized protein n=1 Tax=Macrophomina phaseolina (strain MS6) TaxID=1126212 RepID=K2REX1_MACPH|nr:hypothetical protein MPH_11477 [Macrophomina phaseolina MS6]
MALAAEGFPDGVAPCPVNIPLVRQRISFLEIPIEIRIQIYSVLLKSPAPFELWDKTEIANDYYSPAWEQIRKYASALPTLLRLNKSINAEAAQVFYGANEFRISRHDAWLFLNSFLSTVGENARFLRKLTVHVPFMQFRRPCDFDISTVCRVIEMRRLHLNIGKPGKVPRWSGVPRSTVEIMNAAAFREACQRLSSFAGLRTLQLVLPTSYQVSGRQFTCDEDCDSELESHIKTSHEDWFFWAHLEKLQEAISGLEMSLVMLHEVSGSRCLRTEWSYPSADKNPHLWVLQNAKRRGYDIRYAVWEYQRWSGEHCKYNVVSRNVVQPYFPEWEFPI